MKIDINDNKLTSLLCKFYLIHYFDYDTYHMESECSEMCPLFNVCHWGDCNPTTEELLTYCDDMFKMIKENYDDK